MGGVAIDNDKLPKLLAALCLVVSLVSRRLISFISEREISPKVKALFVTEKSKIYPTL